MMEEVQGQLRKCFAVGRFFSLCTHSLQQQQQHQQWSKNVKKGNGNVSSFLILSNIARTKTKAQKKVFLLFFPLKSNFRKTFLNIKM
jgi:hypothetical protein